MNRRRTLIAAGERSPPLPPAINFITRRSTDARLRPCLRVIAAVSIVVAGCGSDGGEPTGGSGSGKSTVGSATSPDAPAWFGSAVEGWPELEWGMEEEAVAARCGHAVRKLPEPMEFHEAYCPFVIDDYAFGEATFEVRFQFDETTRGLRQILLWQPGGDPPGRQSDDARRRAREAHAHAYSHLVSLYGEPTRELDHVDKKADANGGFRVRIGHLWERDGCGVELALSSDPAWNDLVVVYFPVAAPWRERND